MKRLLLFILLLYSVSSISQEILGSSAKRYPTGDLVTIEYPQGMNPYTAGLRLLATDSITNVGFASYGNSVSGPFAASMLAYANYTFYSRVLMYPSMFQSNFSNMTSTASARYIDSTLPNPNDTRFFKYTPYGGHYSLVSGDTLAATTGNGSGFDNFFAGFVKTPGSGSVTVTLRDLVADTITHTQTISLTSATVDTAAVRFTGLNQNMRYKWVVRCTSDSANGTLISMYYKNGITPLQLGRGGSSFTQNTAANPKVLAQFLKEFNIKLLVLHAREEALPGSLDLVRNVFNSFPNVGKLIVAEIPNADPQVQLNQRAQLYRDFAGSVSGSFVDGTRFFVSRALLDSIGYGGDDGPHPGNGAYDMIIFRIGEQLGWSKMSPIYRGVVDNISDLTDNSVSTSILRIKTNGGTTLADRKTTVLSSAGGGSPGLVNGINFNALTFGTNSVTDPRTITTRSATELRSLGNFWAPLFSVTDNTLTSNFGRVRIATVDNHVATTSSFMYRHTDGNVRVRLFSAGVKSVLLEAGVATAAGAPLKFTTGVNLTTPENGAMEYDGTHLYFTLGGVRYQIDQQPGTTYTNGSGLGLTGTTFSNLLTAPISSNNTIYGSSASNGVLTIQSNTTSGSNGVAGIVFNSPNGTALAQMFNSGVTKFKQLADSVISFTGSINVAQNGAVFTGTLYEYTGSTGSTLTIPDVVTISGFTFTVVNKGTADFNVSVNGGSSLIAQPGGDVSTITLPIGGSAVFTWSITSGKYLVRIIGQQTIESTATSLSLTYNKTYIYFGGSANTTWTLPAVVKGTQIEMINGTGFDIVVNAAGGASDIVNGASPVSTFTITTGAVKSVHAGNTKWFVK